MGIVYSLSRPEFLSTGLGALGRNHARYGVKMSHYRTAHEAFLETIEFTLAEDATPKIINSWDMALSLVFDGMKRGAN